MKGFGGAAVLALLTLLCGCSGTKDSHRPAPTAVAVPPISVTFEDVTAKCGINFKHNSGARGKKYMPETIGSGVAFIDYDNDGWPDLLVVNCKNWPGNKGPRTTPHLYHNNRNGTFTDVTVEAGLDIEVYGMGVAVGDFDNNGYDDIYLTCLGPNHLFRNTLGDSNRTAKRIFEDVTSSAGVAGVPVPDAGMGIDWKWSTSAAWLDYDKDGKLDLFICNYVKWSPKTDLPCGTRERKIYCPPDQFQGVACTLYHNEGGGRFTDVSEATGIRSVPNTGKSLGVSVSDFNGDGWPDIAVANDTVPNFLFINEGGKHFAERGAENGIALGENGKAKAGMGIDAADWEGTGKPGLVIGNFSAEGISLFSNAGNGEFQEKGHAAGVTEVSFPFLTFGAAWLDYDLDGYTDLLTANGHIDDYIEFSNSLLSYKQRPTLYRNLGGGKFAETGVPCGLAKKLVGRGLADADIDNDGALDFAILSNGESVRLYKNVGASRHGWIRFRLEGKRSNRDGIGAIIRVHAGGAVQTQTVHSGGSFLSDSFHEATFGLGDNRTVESVEVVWPGGQVDKAVDLKSGQRYRILEGVEFMTEAPKSRPK